MKINMVNKNNKTIIIIVTLIMCISLLSGCGINDYQKNLYDNEKDLCKQADSYSYVLRVGNTINNKTSIKYGTFYGMDTIFIIDSKESGKITLNYESKIDSGKFKGVLISQDDKVTTIFEGNAKKEETLEVEKGINRIKIVGNNAKGNFNMEIKVPDTMELKK